MAIVLIEEVLMGLDDVRDSLGQAVTVLEGLVEDMPPTMGENLRECWSRHCSCLYNPMSPRSTGCWTKWLT